MYAGKTALTGIKPTGTPHLGNLVGAIKPVLALSAEAARSYVFIADLHALNAVRDSRAIARSTYEIAATFLALGLDTSRTVFFRQSDVPEVYALATLLLNVTAKGLANRAHAYKAEVDRNIGRGDDPDAGVNMGLFTYPVLMAADILLYEADIVPVGPDQKQHVEFARDIAGSCNHAYGGELLRVPMAVISETARAIPGLDGRKMSKSYGNTIPIFEEPEALKKLIARIVTDSRRPEEPKDPDGSSIVQLYRAFAAPLDVEAMRKRFASGGIGYGEAKALLFEAMDAALREPRAKYRDLMADPRSLDDVLAQGAVAARIPARQTLARVSAAMLGRSHLVDCRMAEPDRIDIFTPADLAPEARAAFIALVRSAGEVDEGLPARINTAHRLVLLYRSGTLVGTAAIKNPNAGYHAGRFEKAKAGLPHTDYPRELGWIVVHDDYKGSGLSRLLVEAGVDAAGDGGLYATTRANNGAMLHILPDFGFSRVGVPYASKEHPGEQIVLLVRPGPQGTATR